MIGFTNRQSAYFSVGIQNSKSDTVPHYLNSQIVSFSITEEMSKIITGSINMHDDQDIAKNRILVSGTPITIGWGYKQPDQSIKAAFATKDNPNELTGGLQRDGIKAFVLNVSGGGDEQGDMTYNANFMGSEVYSGLKRKIYDNGTRKDIIVDVLTRMGIRPENQKINFKNGSLPINNGVTVVQNEPNFQFLNRMALYNRALFSIAHGPVGAVALFADSTTPETQDFVKSVGRSQGNSILLNYKFGIANNVMSYTFEQATGDSCGDSAQIQMIGGAISMRRFKAETQTVVDYRMDPDKIAAYLKDFGLKDKAAAMKKLMDDSYNNQELVYKNYFHEVLSTTAPQGYGWSVKVKLLGNPLITAPMRVVFGAGFPELMHSKSGKNIGSMAEAARMQKADFWVSSVTHSISRDGYFCELDIKDSLTITGGSFVM
jgi:hypothetical protein